jgi:Tol biopolymer transport system component
MKRCIALIVMASVIPILGCPRGENAGVEHGNVCIDLSPDGRSLVFSSADGDLYLFDIATKTATRLTETERTESYPSFSPDGKTVLFAASDGDTAPHHIFLLDLSNLGVEQLTDAPEISDILPRFRPDGKQIVFARAYRHRQYSLGGWTWDKWDACEIAADGTQFSRLTTESYYQMYRIIPRTDGSIIYAADLMSIDDEPSAALYSVTSTGKPRRLIPKPSDMNRDVHAWASDPMVASDGVTLAFCSDRERSFWYDVCVSTDDTESRCLVGTKSRYNRYPDFFPDGNRILFLAGMEFNAGSRPVYSLWEVSLSGPTKEIATSDLFTNPTLWLAKEGAEPSDARETSAASVPKSESTPRSP